MFKGVIFDVQHAKTILPSGKKVIFERIKRTGTAIVLAIDKDGKLLLTREYRPRYNKCMWFLPTGRLEKGESPRKAAQRELREETGYRARYLKLIHKAYSGSSMHWPMYMFVAKELTYDPLPLDDGEDIRVVPTSIDKAFKMVLAGKIGTEILSYAIMKLYAKTKKH